MVNDFSDYAKPTQLQVRALPVDGFLSEVVALYEGGPQKFVMQLGAPGLIVEADPVRMRQVMHNLLKNAVEATGDQGRIVISSRVGEEEGNRFVEIAVSDSGPGFDPGLIGQVFEPYVTSKTKGTGLGLAIVKRIVVEHGGVINADNPAGGGGRVVLRLPAAVPKVDPDVTGVPAAGAEGGGA
jgi:nitrogen fixation/metabolism regulation signal transduction histidine kinase